MSSAGVSLGACTQRERTRCRAQHTRYNTNGEFMLIAEHGAGECK